MKRINNDTVSDQVFNQILEQIVEKKWKPGDKIPSENELVKILGVSRLSIREALQRLTALDILTTQRGEGRIVNELNGGTFMKSLFEKLILGKAAIREIYEYRKITELGIIDLIFERSNEEIIKKLDDKINDMEKSIGEPIEFAKADREFHVILAEATNNNVLIQVYYIIKDIIGSLLKEDYIKSHDYKTAIYNHKQIIKSIKEKDKELAIKAINEQYQDALKRLELQS